LLKAEGDDGMCRPIADGDAVILRWSCGRLFDLDAPSVNVMPDIGGL